MRRTLTVLATTLFAGAVLSFPELTFAQHGAMHAAPSAGMAAPRTSFVRPIYAAPHSASPRLGVRVPVAQSSRAHRIATPRQPGVAARHTRHLNIVPFDNFGETDFGDVPGLGFDFPHLAAINGNRHFGRQRFGGVFPFGGGFLFPTEPVIIEEAQPAVAVPQNEEDVVADANDDPRPYHRGLTRSSDSQSQPSSAAAAQAEPDAAPYVFVRRDGELLFAVAYTWQDGTLRYITPQGVRRTIAADALDLGATEQFNEQRGLTFHLPA